MTNYQIGDFLIRVKNAAMTGIYDLSFKKSKMVLAIANTLKEEKFLQSVETEGNYIKVKLAIFAKKPVISNIKIVSRPGLRVYMNIDEIEGYKKPEILILTTPKGVMSARKAKKLRVGGELLAKVI